MDTCTYKETHNKRGNKHNLKHNLKSNLKVKGNLKGLEQYFKWGYIEKIKNYYIIYPKRINNKLILDLIKMYFKDNNYNIYKVFNCYKVFKGGV